MNSALRSLARLLKALQSAGDAGACWQGDGGRYRIAIGHKALHFPLHTVDVALARGLLHGNERLRLSAEGRAALTRLLDPEDGFQAQNQLRGTRTVASGTGREERTVNLAESPLSRLHARKDARGQSFIDEAQFRAGERLRRDFECAGLQPRISANWIASVATGSRSGPAQADISDFAIDARRRLEAATQAIGPELAGIATDVCCFLKGLETVERERGWPPRSAKLMLRTALQMLVRHYGLVAVGGGRPMRQWGGEGYRPSL